MNLRRKRISWIDVARGIGIVLVVYGHVLRGLSSAHLLSAASPVWASDYTIYTFHMPLFFLLAGLQVDRSIAKGSIIFLKNKVRTIAYPYVLWSLIQGGAQLFIPGLLNAPRSVWMLVDILWRPFAQFWFLYVLFLCHVVACLTRVRRMLLVPLLAISFISAALTSGGVPSRFVVLLALAHWFLFYAAGILCGPLLLAVHPHARMAVVWTLLSSVTFGVLAHFGRVLSHNNSDSIASWPATVAGIAMIIGMSHLLVITEVLSGWFEILGRASLTIYILHVFAAAGTRIALEKLQVEGWVLQLIAGTVIGVVVPLALHMWLERIDLLAPLGLGTPRRAAKIVFVSA